MIFTRFSSFPLGELSGTILETVGNTPLVRLRSLASDLPPGIEIHLKIEGQNPGGSIKDRPALMMVLDGLASGALTPDKVILDSTSGNTGIALALIGSILNIPVELCMPSNVSVERKARISAYGANVIYSSPMEGSDGAILEARRLYQENPDRYFKPDQYANPSNPKAHYHSTGPEIWEQTRGRVTHFIAALGTSGTVMGTGRFLKEKNPRVQVIGAEPDNPFHGLEGLKHMESSIVPPIFDRSRLDEVIPVPTEPSYEMARALAREEGIFAGQSSGGSLWAAFHLARRLADQGVPEAVIVAIACDSGDKYYSKQLWDTRKEASVFG